MSQPFRPRVLAGLEHEKDSEAENNPNFGANWDVVKDWKEITRYDPGIKKVEARDLLLAIDDEPDGVLQWLQRHW
jgi:macrodomain Ter protein organizer (MatP/YcbG family)